MEEECSICFEPLASRLSVRTPCAHWMCFECTTKLRMPKSCPMCRASLAHYLPTQSGTIYLAPVDATSAIRALLTSIEIGNQDVATRQSDAAGADASTDGLFAGWRRNARWRQRRTQSEPSALDEDNREGSLDQHESELDDRGAGALPPRTASRTEEAEDAIRSTIANVFATFRSRRAAAISDDV